MMVLLLKYLLPVLSVLLLFVPYVIIKKCNLKEKEQRWKQFRFVYVAIIFVAIVCGFFETLTSLLTQLLSHPSVQAFILNVIPSGLDEYAISLISAIILNAAILIVFCIVKRISKKGIIAIAFPKDWDEMVETKKPIIRYYFWAFLNTIYSLDDKSFLLQKNYVKVKQTLRYFVKAMCTIYIVLVLILYIPFFSTADWVPIELMQMIINTTYKWPAISMIVVCELYYFLTGNEAFERKGRFDKEQSSQGQSADYSELEEEYKRLFQGRYIDTLNPEDPSQNTRASTETKSHPIVEGIKKSLNESLEEDFEINPDYIKHLDNILEGKDVIIDSSIYSEFGEYLFRYLNVVLARGETVLIVCSDPQELRKLRQYVEERLKLINSYHYLWKIDEYENNLGAEDRDILFTTTQIISNDDVFNRRFFNTLSTVIIANATKTIARDNLQLSLLSFKLSNIIQQNSNSLQYICLAESIPLGIRRSLVETLALTNHLVAGDTYKVYNNTKMMLWKYEDSNAPYAQDKLFADHSERYLGLALPIASVALKAGVDMVSLFSNDETPQQQMIDNINTIRHYLNPFFGNVKVDFDKQILFNRYNRQNKYARFAVINDGICNLPMAIYNGARLGGIDTTMIHIISRNYMLRDFFYANADKYIKSESHINMFMPSVADTAKLAVFRILYEMQKNGLPEDEIINRVEKLQPPGASIKTSGSPIHAALRYCIKKATGQDTGSSFYSYFSFNKLSKFQPEKAEFSEYYLVKYTDTNMMNNLMDGNNLAKLFLNNVLIGYADFWSNGIFQRYLPGQHMIIDGRGYKIDSISNGDIHLKNGREDCLIPAGYVQIRQYIVDNTNMRIKTTQERIFSPISCKIIESFVLQSFKAPIEVLTLGYLELKPTGDAFNYLHPNQVIGNEDLRNQAYRRYDKANILDIKINCSLGDNADKSTFLLAVMMNEFFKTWFPYSKDCIAVCPILSDPDLLFEVEDVAELVAQLYPQIRFEAKPEGRTRSQIELYLIEDSATDLGIIQSLMDNWQEMFERIFANLREYLNWQQNYEDKGDDNINNKYLYFGKESEPECFDFKTLSEVLNEMEELPRVNTADTDTWRISKKGICSFCGEPIQSVQVNTLADGRIMCAQCAKLIVTDSDELKKIYSEAVNFLTSEFGVTIPDDIKVRFATAESIRLRMRTGNIRVVLGFADSANRELWVESDSPETNLSDVIVHELTHFWQFDNISCDDSNYIEGQPSFVEVQYLRKLGKNTWANYIEASLEQRDDSYGVGYRMINNELTNLGDLNSFTYMKKKFGK